jgi:F-type H+-transporting ATPase subunit delta
VREVVRGYAAAVFESAGPAGTMPTVRGDLMGIARAVNDSDELRTVLTDSVIPSATRRAIVIDLLEGRAERSSVSLAAFTVAMERPPEVPATLAELVELAEAEIDRLESGAPLEAEPPASRREILERISGFAERVLQELESRSEIDTVEDELFQVARILESSRELRNVLSDDNLTYSGRAAVIDDLFGRSLHKATVRLVRYVIRAGRLRDLVGAINYLVQLAAEERGRRIAEVRSAVALDDEERTRVAQALSRLTDRNVEVREILDPSVIGGIRASVGDLILDGTVRLRVERLRDLLVKAS